MSAEKTDDPNGVCNHARGRHSRTDSMRLDVWTRAKRSSARSVGITRPTRNRLHCPDDSASTARLFRGERDPRDMYGVHGEFFPQSTTRESSLRLERRRNLNFPPGHEAICNVHEKFGRPGRSKSVSLELQRKNKKPKA